MRTNCFAIGEKKSTEVAAQVVTVETKGAKIIGVIALVLAVTAIFLPFVGIWVGILSCLLAIYPAISRFGRVWALCTSIMNAINALFLTPTFWISLGLAGVASSDAQRGRVGAEEASSVFSFGHGCGLFALQGCSP